MGFDVESIKSALKFGGARPSKFEVRLQVPGIATSEAISNQQITFMAFAASIPAQQLGVVQVPYWGRKIPIAGDRTYGPWTISIINDEGYPIRRIMEQWSHRINTARKNTTIAPFTSDPASYKADASVYTYTKEGILDRTYRMVGCWPSTVSQIDLDWNATDQLMTFNVEFQFDYWDNEDNILNSDGAGASNLFT